MTIGSLFSGIGGLELGLERAGLGPTVWQVERDPKCRAVLARHWPDAERYDDICTVDTDRLAAVDLICGGFPCQDLSSAGKRAGLGGARSGMWREFRRVVATLLPRWVVVENVASGARNWVDAIRGDLGQLGYETLPIPLAASDVGAWHRRARVFVVAYRNPGHQQDTERARREWRIDPTVLETRRLPAADALAAVGIESQRAGRRCKDADASAVAHAVAPRKPQPRGPEPDERRRLGNPNWPDWNPWTAEPDVARVVHGLPGRVDRERQLGNSVVPQCAEVIGWVIRYLDHGNGDGNV